MGARDFSTHGIDKTADWGSHTATSPTSFDPMKFEVLDRAFFENPYLIHNDGSEFGAVSKEYLRNMAGFSSLHTEEEEQKASQKRQKCAAFRFAVQELCKDNGTNGFGVSNDIETNWQSWDDLVEAKSEKYTENEWECGITDEYAEELYGPDYTSPSSGLTVSATETSLLMVKSPGEALASMEDVNSGYFSLGLIDKTVADVSAKASMSPAAPAQNFTSTDPAIASPVSPTSDFNAATTVQSANAPQVAPELAGFKTENPLDLLASNKPAPSAPSPFGML